MRIAITILTILCLGTIASTISLHRQLARSDENLAKFKEQLDLHSHLPSASDPKGVVVAFLRRGRFDGTDAFIRLNQQEIEGNLEITSLEEADRVAVAFYRFRVGFRVFKDAVWLRKEGDRYHLVPFISKFSRSQFTRLWISGHEAWLATMETKMKDWAGDTADAWLDSAAQNQVQNNALNKNACIANLKQIDGATQQWALENKKGATDSYRLDDRDLLSYLRGSMLPTCPSRGTYSAGQNVSDSPRCSVPGHTL